MPRPNWSRALPKPLLIPDVMLLATLADVRTLMQHLPADRRERQTWRQVAADIEAAASGGDIEGAAIGLRMVPTATAPLAWRNHGAIMAKNATNALISRNSCEMVAVEPIRFNSRLTIWGVEDVRGCNREPCEVLWQS